MIKEPTLIVDEGKCWANINLMCAKAQIHGLDLRPHFKTHQSLEIGRWFKEMGINKITVSSVTMAEYFSSEWSDITIAFPVNLLEVNEINDLANNIKLNILVESIESARFLSGNAKAPLNIYIKIDVGTHRTGMDPDNINLIDDVLSVVNSAPLLNFEGFLGHAGHTYNCRNQEEIRQVHATSLDIMRGLRVKYLDDYPNLVISLGDTPGCSVAEDFSGVSEIRPGNFAFYDLMQYRIGSCSVSQIAVALACPIVAIHRDRGEIVVYGGGVHLSKERIEDSEGTIYGRIAEGTESGWGETIPNMYVKGLSQEHGIISVPDQLIDQYEVGEYLMVLPVHSCMTVNLVKYYRTCDGRRIDKLN